MVNLARVKQIQERFDRATYLTVYTREAHPTESGDYIDYQYPVNDHKSLEDRLEAANQLLSLETLPGPPPAGQYVGRGLQGLWFFS